MAQDTAPYPIHTVESAPVSAEEAVQKSLKRYGFLPNLHGIMVEAPGLLKAYHAVQDEFESSSLSREEQQIVALSVSVQNQCHYCVAGHTMLARGARVPEDQVQGLRDGTPLADARREALRSFTQSMVEKRGWVTQDEVGAFLAAGYTWRNVLEIIVGIAYKTLSNFTNHIADTPLDDVVVDFAWEGTKSDA